MSFLKKYWAEILVFGAVATVMFVDLLPAYTWINTDSDGAHYTLAAKYLWVAHNTSAPLFLLLGHLFLQLPFGTEAWRFGTLLALSTVITTIFIYLIVKQLLMGNSGARFYALIASLVYGGSALVISQSTIIDTYAFDTMLIIIAYYFVIRKQFVWTSVFLGLCLATHPLMFGLAWFVMFFAHKELRNWKMIALTVSFLLFYLYIPISKVMNSAPDMWGNTSIISYIKGNWGTITMLTGGLSIWDFPKRVLDTIGILGVCWGLGIVAIIWHFIKKGTYKYELLWLTLIYILYFMANLSAETYVYMITSIAFGAIVVGLGLAKMRRWWSYAVLVVAIGLLSFNANYFDIGRTLDPEMSAMKFYNEELPKIPDGQIFMAGGWNWAMTYLYNKEENRNIIPVCTDTLPNEAYIDVLIAQGVKIEKHFSNQYLKDQANMMLSIATLNDNVWVCKPVKPEVYQYVVEPARDNMEFVIRWMNAEATTQPGHWQWKPSNPYDYITGALEVNEWTLVLASNYNVVFFATIIMGGFMINGYMWKWLDRRKRNKRLAHGDIPNIQA